MPNILRCGSLGGEPTSGARHSRRSTEPTLDGYPFDARYSEGARDEAVRLAELTKDAYDYFASVFPGARPQIIATFLKPADWKRNYGVPSYYPPDRRLRSNRPHVSKAPNVTTKTTVRWTGGRLRSTQKTSRPACGPRSPPRSRAWSLTGPQSMVRLPDEHVRSLQEFARLEVDMTTAVTSTLDLCFGPATELARRIRDRQISATEVTDAFLARIAAHNHKINAIVQLFERDARSRAKEADEALARGQNWGPLHGVPVTIKEMFLMANTRSTLNARRMKDFVASEDGVIVQRLKSAGAVILGKTNVPANLQGYQVRGDLYPEGKNPHRLESSPGGSTGGGAAAVAAGMTALELGADGGGSLRVPAHFCGVYCLKPTDKTIPRYGGIPLATGTRRFLVNMVQPGPLARSIDDLELLWTIIRGPDPSDFEVAPIEWRPPSGRSLAQLRVAWTDGFQEYVAGAETREQLAALAARIAHAGARVQKAVPEIYPRATQVFVHLLGALLGQDMPWLVRKIFPVFVARGLLKGQPNMVRVLRRALTMNTRDYAAALGAKRALVEDIERFFSHHDVLLAPVSYGPAFTRCKEGSPLDFDGALRPYNDYCWPYVGPFNASGHPALVMPLGTSKDGLPIGVQLVGAYWSEPELLHIARQLASLTSGFVRPHSY